MVTVHLEILRNLSDKNIRNLQELEYAVQNGDVIGIEFNTDAMVYKTQPKKWKTRDGRYFDYFVIHCNNGEELYLLSDYYNVI